MSRRLRRRWLGASLPGGVNSSLRMHLTGGFWAHDAPYSDKTVIGRNPLSSVLAELADQRARPSHISASRRKHTSWEESASRGRF
jgi:hypothetical protein